MSGVLQQFVRTFFDENPLSQLGVLVARNGVAERLSDLSSSPVRRWQQGGAGRRMLGQGGTCWGWNRDGVGPGGMRTG